MLKKNNQNEIKNQASARWMQYFLINTSDVVIVVKKKSLEKRSETSHISSRSLSWSSPLKCVIFYACTCTQRTLHVWKDGAMCVFDFSSPWSLPSHGSPIVFSFISLLFCMHICRTLEANKTHSASNKHFMFASFRFCVFNFYDATFTVLLYVKRMQHTQWCTRCCFVLAMNARISPSMTT